MKNCTHDLESLILFQAGELDAEAREGVADRLEACDSCSAEMARLAALAERVAQPLEFDASATAAARARAYARIGGSWNLRLRRTLAVLDSLGRRLAPIPQLALAVVLVGTGYWVGSSRADRKADAVVGTVIIDVRDVEVDPATGMAVVRFERMEERAVTGGLSDASISMALYSALEQGDDPRIRLHALRTIGALASTGQPDPELTAAVVEVIRAESNDALKLRAIDAVEALFRHQPLPEKVRSALLEALVSGSGDGVRIAALEVLMGHEPDQRDIGRLRQVSTSDPNPYVRAGASRTLSRLESVPLEALDP